MKNSCITCFLILFAVWIAQGQERRDGLIPPKIEAAQQTYKKSKIAVVACVYKIEQEVVNKHTIRAVISATVTEVLKGDWKIGRRITISKYFEATNEFKLDPGALRFLLLPEIELGKEVVAASGEMPDYSEELHEALSRMSKRELPTRK